MMYTGKKLGEAIEKAIEKKGVSKKSIADRYGVKPPPIHDWIKRGTIGKDKIFDLINYFSDVCDSSHWGIQEGSVLGSFEVDNSDISHVHNKVINNKYDGIIIEQYDAVGAMGNGLILKDQSGVINEWNVSEEWIRLNLKNYTKISNIKIVTGFGDSMQGTFNSGDPVIIDVGITTVDYDSAYFFRVGNEGYIKRLQRVPGIGLRAISANKEYEPWSITKDMDFQVFGVVLRTFNSVNFQ